MTVRTDPELGPVRWCRACEEEWPDDEEFWGRYVIPAGAATGNGYHRKSPVTIVRCRACGTNWMKPRLLKHPELIIGRVVETTEGTFLVPLDRYNEAATKVADDRGGSGAHTSDPAALLCAEEPWAVDQPSPST